MVSSTPGPHFTPGKDPVPILQEAGWAPGPVWTGRKSRPHWDLIPDRPSRSQSLYRLSYLAHLNMWCYLKSMYRVRNWTGLTESALLSCSIDMCAVMSKRMATSVPWKTQCTTLTRMLDVLLVLVVVDFCWPCTRTGVSWKCYYFS